MMPSIKGPASISKVRTTGKGRRKREQAAGSNSQVTPLQQHNKITQKDKHWAL